jgi:hypothetical protein
MNLSREITISLVNAAASFTEASTDYSILYKALMGHIEESTEVRSLVSKP